MDSRDRRPEQRRTNARALVLAFVVVAMSGAASYGQTFEDAIELHLNGELDRALAAYAAVAATVESSEPNVAAAAFTNTCAIRMNRSEYELALEACEHALRLRRSTEDLPPTARTLNNLGLTLQNLGRHREARERYLEAIEINRSLDDWGSLAQNLLNLSGVEIQAGDYGAALERIDAVVELTEEHPEADWAPTQRRIAYLNQGVTFEKLGAYRVALESYRQALDQDGPADESLDALLNANLGVVYRNLGDPVRALELFERAEAVYRRIDSPSGISNALLNQALALHLNLDRPESAERAYRDALALAQSAGDLPEEIQDLFYLATLLLEQDRLDEAKELFGQALSKAEVSGSAEGRWSALYGLGRVALAEGERARAAEHFQRALDLVEGVRSQLTTGSHRQQFFGEKRPIFEAAVLLAAESTPDDDAQRSFALVQRAKARELLDALGGSSDTSPRSAEEIAATLPDASLLLEFFVAEGRLLRWSVDRRQGVRVESLGDFADALAAIQQVHRALSGSETAPEESLELLSTTLLAGLGSIDDRRLIIAPDRGLRYLPFELLSAPDDDGRPLIDLATVTYLPSGSTLPRSAHDRRPALNYVAVANPRLPPPGTTARPAALLAARFGLGELAAAEREIDSMERWLGGPAETLVGERATEAALRTAIRTGSRVIHLAAHTVIDERPGRGAAVLLTPGDEDDGLLEPREIAGLELGGVDLAVLAGCRTALAENAGGSIATLTGAFLAAGASAVVATLWDVGDESTAAFMDQFYWQLGRGNAPAEALRRTKDRFREQEEWRAPHLWAGYVLIGEAPAIAGRGVPWVWLGMALAVLAGLALWFRRRRTVY